MEESFIRLLLHSHGKKLKIRDIERKQHRWQIIVVNLI